MTAVTVPGERVNDITFWKEELNAEIREMDSEIENLQVQLQIYTYLV